MSIVADAANAGEGLCLDAAETAKLYAVFRQMASLKADLAALPPSVDIEAEIRSIANAAHDGLADEEILGRAYRIAYHDFPQVSPETRRSLDSLLKRLEKGDNPIIRLELRMISRALFGLGIPFED